MKNDLIERRWFLAIAAGGASMLVGLTGCGGGGGSGADTSAQSASTGDRTTLSPMTLARSTATTDHSIGVIVTAGSAGAPAGFTLQWIKASELAAFWSEWPSDAALLCATGFSGSGIQSPSALAPNQSTEIVVENYLLDKGNITNCGGPLEAATDYVFRALTNGGNSLPRSSWTANYTFSTLPI